MHTILIANIFILYIELQLISLVFNDIEVILSELILRTLILLELIKFDSTSSHSIFKVSKFEDINNKIIPIFKDHPIIGIKQLDFQDFCLIATLMGDKQHLNHEGLCNIKLIKDKMNTNRK